MERRRKRRRTAAPNYAGLHHEPGWSCSNSSNSDNINREGADQSYDELVHLEPDPDADGQAAP